MDILMPQLGETVAEGKILKWFRNVGDEVAEGDNIFEVETDKVTIEVQAIAAGKLTEVRVAAGEVVKVGTVVGVIGGANGASVPVAQTESSPPEVAAPSQHKEELDPFTEVRTASGHYGAARALNGIRVSPLARRLIAQSGLDQNAVAEEAARLGETRILQRHVRSLLEAPRAQATHVPSAPPRPAPPPTAQGDLFNLNSVRRKTGERLADNWRTIPHVFQGIEVDFGAIDLVRAKHKATFKAAHGLSLTYLPFIARAACIALRAFPQINAHFGGDKLHLSHEINLGIAVDLDHDSLVVPVIRNADELNVVGLAKAISRLAQKARAGKLTPDEMQGGTYTISNNGAFGTMFTAPIINAPQVAILSTDAVRKRPAVVETPQGDLIAVRPVGVVAQSFDHRAFDGAYSAAFLSRLKIILETRDWASEF
jgi:pyruvate/2-oxoglutarate dehydrogenase complex dihydrolipoamide acyltransferase (E2) component